jgi:hypothetical protein
LITSGVDKERRVYWDAALVTSLTSNASSWRRSTPELRVVPVGQLLGNAHGTTAHR